MLTDWREDEIILRLQRGIDRFACRLRGANPQPQSQRRFIIIQIDGLSHSRLKAALEKRRMPFVRRLLRRGESKESPIFCSLPTSTAAFQAGLFYGNIPDVPAWKFYDKRLRQVIHFPIPGSAALVEAREARSQPGILAGGVSYGAVFSGDSETSIASFSRFYQPKFGFNWETLWFLLPNLITLWVFLKIFALLVYELVYGFFRILRDLFRHPRHRLTLGQLIYHVFFHVIWRQLLTLGVSADIYHGVPRIFVNYLSYDVFAHKYGPSSRIAFRSLKAIDASIRQIYRIVRRVPEYNYDIFIISDHGMAEALPFEEVSQQPLARVVLGALASGDKGLRPQTSAIEVINDSKAVEHLDWLAHLRGIAPFLPFSLAKIWKQYLHKQENKWLQKLAPQLNLSRLLDEVKIVPAGPNVLIYFMHRAGKVSLEEIEARYPGSVARLSRQAGIGIVLARDAGGAVFYWRGEKFRADAAFAAPRCPFRQITYRPLLMRAICELMEMPSAGDLIIYGNCAGRATISYIGERGTHAGLSADELFAFIIFPKDIDFAFERVARPSDLYLFFLGYQNLAGRQDLISRRSAG
jgi:hypothetical protein